MTEQDEINELSKEIAHMSDMDTIKGIPQADVTAIMEDLDDLDLAFDLNATIDEVTHGVILEDVVDLDDEAMEALDMKIEQQESYASQTSITISTVDPDDLAAGQASVKTSKARKTSSAPRAASAPRVERDLTKIDPSFFQLEGEAVAAGGLSEQVRDDVLVSRPTQKKVAEKFENLFISLAAGRKPSTFVVDAAKLLKAKGKLVNSELVAAYSADGYDIGTARSQAGQIVNLFQLLKITQPGGDLNPASTLMKRIEDVAHF